MSELAPFVASVLKDKAMVEMIAELEKLRRLVDERLKVQITGRKGQPVYREGSLKEGYTSHRGRCFEVMFDDNDKNTGSKKLPSGTLPLTNLQDLEIRLGGSVIQRLDIHTVVGSCNAPFFTNDDFYRDSRYNKPELLAPDRKEIILKIKTRRRGPVPFVIARFGDEMNFSDYEKLNQLDMAGLMDLSESKIVPTIVLEGLTFSKPEIEESLNVLGAMGYGVDQDNGHKQYIHSIDSTRVPSERSMPSSEPRRNSIVGPTIVALPPPPSLGCQ